MVVKIGKMKRLKVLSMRFLGPVIIAVVLVACESPVPDSGAGVGFDTYSDYEAERAARDAELAGAAPTVSGSEISDEAVEAGMPVPTTSSPASVQTSTDNPAISDEQNFDAVSARETIESDAERLAAQREAYTIIQPTALPTRRGATGPSIVEFALATTNLVGQSIYSRMILGAQSRFDRNCAKYTSSDKAQADFLTLGGPKRDRKGLDPDGDGFACYWDPAPFRQAVRN
jgi:hypothetical protein